MPLAAVVMNVMVEMLSNTSVNVSWESIDTSELIISYRVYYNQPENTDAFVDTSSNSVVINDLICNVEYLFYVVVTAEVDGQTFTGQRSMTVIIGAVSTECIYVTWKFAYLIHDCCVLIAMATLVTVSTSPPACSAPVVTCSRTELSVAVVVTFLLTVILNTSIIFITYYIYHHHKGIKKE